MKGVGQLNGGLFVEYVENLVKQINGGSLPKMQDTYT